MGSFSPEMLFRTMKSLLAATAMALVLSAGTAERATAQGAVKSFVDDGLFINPATGQNTGIVSVLMGLAEEADEAQRGF